MGKFNLPDPRTFDGNIGGHWKHWRQELELCSVATEKDKKENIVKSVFIYLA